MTRQEFRFRSLYALLGLFIGSGCFVISAWLFVRGVSSDYHLKIWGVEMNAASPGLGIAALGVLVIRLTRLNS